jgi:hypothetical protein
LEVLSLQDIIRQYNDTPLSKGTSSATCKAEVADLLEALESLLRATVDDDLNHGIALTEAEDEAREMALSAIAKIRGNYDE